MTRVPSERLSVQCCVAGGGPAGLMLGFLLARAGVDVLVLEKHPDFLRDFRGDTIHPSTLEVMHELGLLEEFLKLPHQRVHQLSALVGEIAVPVADLSHLPTRCRFIAFMPQWDFLNFLAERARRFPSFALRMQAEVTGLIDQSRRVVGVRATVPSGLLEVRAALVVGADGRHSVVREEAKLEVDELGAPMDVLWFRVSRSPDDPGQTMGRFGAGRVLITIDRGEYWQVGYVIPKGSLDEIRSAGLESFRARVAEAAPFMGDRVRELGTWDVVKLLTVRVDRLRRWYQPGLLCIGDAAHAMSPVGGVGINLAIQDAVAAANLLAAPLRANRLAASDLARVQRRRQLPTRITQRFQVILQRRVISRVLENQRERPRGNPRRSRELPVALRLLRHFPLLRRIPARLIGIGVRPEHIRTPAVSEEASE
jgi:2-polyprenyl-6-methoxyphenol hydroxylase-like FAD-dependent oxidoreductase